MKITVLKRSLLLLFIFSIHLSPICLAVEEKNQNNSNKTYIHKEPKYRLGPGDVIKLKVFQLPDFNTTTKISWKILAPSRLVVKISRIKPATLEIKVQPPTLMVEKKFKWEAVLSVT